MFFKHNTYHNQINVSFVFVYFKICILFYFCTIAKKTKLFLFAIEIHLLFKVDWELCNSTKKITYNISGKLLKVSILYYENRNHHMSCEWKKKKVAD